MKGATLIGEKDFALNDEVDILWYLILAVDHGFKSADIHRVQIMPSWLCALKQLKLHVNHDKSPELFLSPAENGLKHGVEVLKEEIEELLLKPRLQLIEEVLSLNR